MTLVNNKKKIKAQFYNSLAIVLKRKVCGVGGGGEVERRKCRVSSRMRSSIASRDTSGVWSFDHTSQECIHRNVAH